MKASVLAIGDEIVSGLTQDTNSSHLARLLTAVGVEIASGYSTPDDPEAIRRVLEHALDDAQLVVTTGGLGPTADDLTAACIADLAGVDLRLDEVSLSQIIERFHSRGMEMPESNRRQALFPAGSTIIPNAIGTAPGFICPVSTSHGERHIAALPGVPREMRRMAEETLIPWAAARAGHTRIASRVFSTFGLAESRLDELLTGVVAPGEGRLAFRAAFPRVQARVTLTGDGGADLDRRLERISEEVRKRLALHLYAESDTGLEEVVSGLLLEASETLAVAESCTGGLIGHRLTNVPGSSGHFLLDVVAYSNEAKERLLGVSPDTLRAHGAVSVEVAAEMAAGVRRASGASIGLATTGIAGPGGGTPEKPVGTVCVALDAMGRSWTRRYDLGSRDREWIKEMTTQIAMERLRRLLLGIDLT